MKPVVFGCAGLGNFAGGVCDRLLAHSQMADPPVQLAAVCDPQPQRFAQRVATLRAAGVKVFKSFDELLAEPIEAVWLPLPIELHRPFTERALAAGKAVLCEKPAAGCVDDVDGMIAARDRSKLHVAVGFQDVYQPQMIDLKKQLLSGDLGKPKWATLMACWPRGERYYHRTTWAGALQRNGTWILDSPASNAIAHYIHLVMYLLGAGEAEAAAPTNIQAELYRASSIENYDTCCLRIRLADSLDFLVLLTHGCDRLVDPQISIETEGAAILLSGSKLIEVRKGDKLQSVKLEGSRYTNVINAYSQRLRGVEGAPPGGTLEMARAHIIAINGASQAAPVNNIPADWITATPNKDWGSVCAIRNIESILHQCAERRQTLHESGLVPWAVPPQSLDLHNYRHFSGPAQPAAVKS